MQSDLNDEATGVVPVSIVYRPFDVTDDYGFATEAEMGLKGLAWLAVHTPDNGVPMLIAAGYSVYAVKLDEAGEVVTGQLVSGPGLRIGEAAIVAEVTASRPDRFGFAFDVNFLIVNDGAGHTVDKFAVPRVAA